MLILFVRLFLLLAHAFATKKLLDRHGAESTLYYQIAVRFSFPFGVVFVFPFQGS